MRNVLISLAAAASAVGLASPASAQWAPPPPQPYGYGSQHYGGPGYGMPGYGMPGYGNGYGYNHHSVHNLKVRIDSIQRQIRFLERRNILTDRKAWRLRQHSLGVEHRLVHAARHGLSPWEARDIETRIARLEHRVHREAMNRNGRWGRHAGRYDGDHRWERQHDGWHDRHDD